MSSTNCYGTINPLYPTYDDKDVELEETMRFFQFAYQPSSGYAGTAVFEILDTNNKKYTLSIKCDPNTGVETSRTPPSNDKDITFHCTLPWDTFHDVFWGYATPKTLVMGGGVKIKNWAYRAAYNFGISFDMTSANWVKYYESGNSIKKMLNHTEGEEEEGGFVHDTLDVTVNSSRAIEMVEGIENVNTRLNTQRIRLYDYKAIGPTLPTSANETEFMYQWQPSLEVDVQRKQPLDAWEVIKEKVSDWSVKQRDMISSNNMKQISLFDGEDGYYGQLRRYGQNLMTMNGNPLTFGQRLKEKWKIKIEDSSTRMVDEYYGYYSQYTRNKIGAISLSFMNNSLDRFYSFIHKNTSENEVAHFGLLTTLF